MSVTQITKAVRDAIYSRLSNPVNGFNPLISTKCSQYGISPYSIDFSTMSKNFFFGQIDAEALEQSGIFSYPFISVYGLEAICQEGDAQKFSKFSGQVRVLMDVWLSWKSMRGLQDYEVHGDAVEEVVIDVMNRENNQNFLKPLVYNGNVAVRRYPLRLAGENWRQRINFSFIFGVHTL